MAKIPKIKIQGVGSIPAGYFLGRTSPGVGDVELLSPTHVAQAVAATGMVSTPGAHGSASNGMLPLVTGDITPGGQPFFIIDDVGQCIGVPL